MSFFPHFIDVIECNDMESQLSNCWYFDRSKRGYNGSYNSSGSGNPFFKKPKAEQNIYVPNDSRIGNNRYLL